jgi:hypothetical protein
MPSRRKWLQLFLTPNRPLERNKINGKMAIATPSTPRSAQCEGNGPATPRSIRLSQSAPVLATVRSDDSSVFSGLSNSPDKRLRGSKSGSESESGTARDSDAEVGLVKDHFSQTGTESYKFATENSEQFEPSSDSVLRSSHGDTVLTSYSTEERKFLRNHLPNMADRDTAFGAVYSESQFNEECEYNEEIDDSSMASAFDAQQQELTNNEGRIAAMFDDYEKQMNADLEVIRESVEESFEKSSEGAEDIDDYRYNIVASPRRVRSAEEERQVLTQKQAKEMQRVLHQARREVEVLRDNNEQFMSEIEQTEEEHESEMKLVENRTKQRMTELRALYQHEMDLLIQEKDAAIVEAGNQAAQYTEAGRQKISTLKKQIEKHKSQHKNIIKAAVKVAVKNQTEKVKQQKEEEFSKELAVLHQQYEDKLEKIKSDNDKEIKTTVDKAVAHLTHRLTSDREQDVSETITLVLKRLENEKQIALDEQRTTLQKNGELEQWGNELMREKNSVKQMLELLKANLMKHHQERINEVLMQKPSERPGSRYFNSIPETLSTDVEMLCQEVLSTHASLLVYAETKVQRDGNTEIRMGDEMEEIRKERSEVYAALRKKLLDQHEVELSDMKKQKDDAADRIQHLEAALKNMGRGKRFIEDKFRRATDSHKVELQNLHAERDTMLEMEKGRKELAVAMAAGQLELAHTMASARDTLVRPGQNTFTAQKSNSETVGTDIKCATTEREKEEAGQREGDREITEQKKTPAVVKDKKQSGREYTGFKFPKKRGLRAKSHAGIFGLSFKKAEAISRTVDDADDFNAKSAASAASAPSRPMGVNESVLELAPSAAFEPTKIVGGAAVRVKKVAFSSSNSDASSAVELRSYASTALSNFKVKKAHTEVSAAPKDTMGTERSVPTAPIQESTTPEQVADVKKAAARAAPHFLTQQNILDHKLVDPVKPKSEPIGTRASVEDNSAINKGFPILNAFKSTSRPSNAPQAIEPEGKLDSSKYPGEGSERESIRKPTPPKVQRMKSFFENMSQDDSTRTITSHTNESTSSLRAESGAQIPRSARRMSDLRRPPHYPTDEREERLPHSPSGARDERLPHSPSGARDERLPHSPSGARHERLPHSPSGARHEHLPHFPSDARDERLPHSPSDARDELQTLHDTTNDDGRELPRQDSYQTAESPHVPSIHQSQATYESPTQSEMVVQLQGLKKTTPLGMFAQLSKTSKTAQEPSVAKYQVPPRQKLCPGGVCADGSKGGSDPPPSSSYAIKLRKTWINAEPTPSASMADETEKRDEEPTDESCIQQNLRKPPLSGFPGRHGEKSLTPAHVINGKKPAIAGNPDYMQSHNVKKATGQSGDYEGKVPTTISVQAEGKKQYATSVVKGHTMCIGPLPVAKKSQSTTEQHLERKVSGLSIESNRIEMLVGPTSETADTTDYTENSQSQLRNYPTLGDESDDESNESGDRYGSAEDLDDRYATFTPLQFAAASVQPDIKRVPIVISRSVDSPVFYMESNDEKPIVVQGKPIYRQPSLSAFTPTRDSGSKDISSVSSTTETNVSQATTAVTAHTLQSLRSTQLKDPFYTSLKGQSSALPRGSGSKPSFAATMRARRLSSKNISNQ